MGVNLNAYLHFDGQAADALAFYAEVLGGRPSITTFGQAGMEGPLAAKVMHGDLETTSGITLMCSDLPYDHPVVERGNGMNLCLSGDDADALRESWKRLTENGVIETPLEKQMWGDEFGQCTDRFGVAWLINITGSTL